MADNEEKPPQTLEGQKRTAQDPSDRESVNVFDIKTRRHSAAQAAPGQKPYEAFKVTGQGKDSLQIRQVLGSWEALEWRYLMKTRFNGERGTEIVLVFSHMMVKVKGRHLQALTHSLLEKTCVFIQDFHSHEFSPPQPGAAIIETIEIIMAGEAEDV